jgi:hypothetical protein
MKKKDLEKYKQDRMLEEAIASAELAEYHTIPPKCFTCKNLMEPMKEKDGSKSKHSFHCLKCYPNLIISIG